jgi:uncharacterized integral membrane protein
VRAPGWLAAAGVTLLAAAFAWFNRGERVAVDLGLIRFYRAPLTVVAFLAFLAGMLSMLLLSLRHDRRLREELRARGLLEPARPEPARAAAASAWGVTREPAPAREADERTVVRARDEDGRTVAYAGDDEERTAAYSPDGDDRTAGYARDQDERTISYPRYEEDPAA